MSTSSTVGACREGFGGCFLDYGQKTIYGFTDVERRRRQCQAFTVARQNSMAFSSPKHLFRSASFRLYSNLPTRERSISSGSIVNLSQLLAALEISPGGRLISRVTSRLMTH